MNFQIQVFLYPSGKEYLNSCNFESPRQIFSYFYADCMLRLLMYTSRFQCLFFVNCRSFLLSEWSRTMWINLFGIPIVSSPCGGCPTYFTIIFQIIFVTQQYLGCKSFAILLIITPFARKSKCYYLTNLNPAILLCFML